MTGTLADVRSDESTSTTSTTTGHPRPLPSRPRVAWLSWSLQSERALPRIFGDGLLRLGTAADRALSTRAFAVWLAAIVVIGALLRMFWLFRYGWQIADLRWDDVPILTSGDGYWFASGAVQLTSGGIDMPNLPGAASQALVAVAAGLAELLPVSLESVLLYLPVVVGPLIALPIAFIGRALGRERLGLIAALLAVCSPIFLNRTSAGYFDTDVFALLVPLLVVHQLVRVVLAPGVAGVAGVAGVPGEDDAPGEPGVDHARRPILWAGLWLALYPYAYDRGAIIGVALVLVALTLAALRRHPQWLVMSIVFTVAAAPLPWFLRLGLVVVTWAGAPLATRVLRHRLDLQRARPWLIGLAVLVMASAFIGLRLWEVIPAKLEAALGEASQAATTVSDIAGVRAPTYGEAASFIVESQPVSLTTLGARVSGHLALFAVAMFGFVLLLWQWPVLLLLLPLAGLGLFAMPAGVRFGIYLTPIYALGLAHLVVMVGRALSWRSRQFADVFRVALVVALVVPNALAAWPSFTPTALIAPEVAALTALRTQSAPRDATVTWWDYGYPVVYFSRTRVFADGGRHGEDAGLVAEILMNPSQPVSARLARAAAEVQEELRNTDWALAPTIFLRARERGLDLESYLASLASEAPASPRLASHTFMFLPTRLLTLLPTIERLRPETPGHERERPYYQLWQGVSVEGSQLRIGPGIFMDPARIALIEAGSVRPLKAMISVAGSGPALEVRSRAGSPTATTTGLYLHDHALFIELDDAMLRSTVIQLLVFERADPEVYELVFANGAAKVWRSKL